MKAHTVKGPNYQSDFFLIDDHLTYLVRQHHWPRKTRLIETFGNQTLLFIASHDPALISVTINGEAIPNPSFSALLIPPFSLVQWDISPCTIHWEAYALWMPQTLTRQTRWQPAGLQWDPNKFMTSAEEFMLEVENSKKCFTLHPQIRASSTALRVKACIDRYREENLTIEQIGKQLNIPYSTLALEFKKAFGVSASWYRNQLRIYDSLNLLLRQDKNATYVAYEMGFGDFSTYFRNMKKIFSLKPSQFKRETVPQSNDPHLKQTPTSCE